MNRRGNQEEGDQCSHPWKDGVSEVHVKLIVGQRRGLFLEPLQIFQKVREMDHLPC
jgi:hypothetical protein